MLILRKAIILILLLSIKQVNIYILFNKPPTIDYFTIHPIFIYSTER